MTNDDIPDELPRVTTVPPLVSEIVNKNGEILDRVEGAITGTLEVTRVTEKVSYCKVVDGELPVRGDAVVGI